jgi:hypothetical protein
MKRAYLEKRFSAESHSLIAICNEIIEDYQGQGLRLTLRQLYYQLVTKNVIANVPQSYKRLSSLLSDARLAGLVDWAAIEDRGRRPYAPIDFEDLDELVDWSCDVYRLPRWRNQKLGVELWVEKEALAGVLKPLADEFHVTLMVNKGYSSQSAMFESALRTAVAAKNRTTDKLHFELMRQNKTKHTIIFYLGDHDPSGEDMVRDVQERLDLFGAGAKVIKLALTTDQVEEYDPPPNPAKLTDPRAEKYIEKHGPVSWEVDALPPETLAGIIRNAFEQVVDKKKLKAVLAQEKKDRARLQRVWRAFKDTEDDE